MLSKGVFHWGYSLKENTVDMSMTSLKWVVDSSDLREENSPCH